MNVRYLFSLILALIVLPSALRAQAQCDQDRSCVGTALTITQTMGKGAQYVDIDRSPELRALDTALTFEAWLKPERQSGLRQYVGGLWGPNRDNNDQWVVYIEDNRIVFALSSPTTRLGDVDNTIAIADVPDLYTRGWVHVAAVWSGQTASSQIIIDGYAVGVPTINTAHPIRNLNQIENGALPLQIASTNALFGDTTRYRSFKGQLDEIRIWDRALSETEVRCQRVLSLQGTERGLVLYYRCNDGNNADLCDATNNGARGRMRSGAACRASDRIVPATFTVLPAAVNTTVACIGDTTFSFSASDTSSCGSLVNLRIVGTDAALFTLSTSTLTLAQNAPQNFTVRMRSQLLGPITATLEVTKANRCGVAVLIPLSIT
ncbi:MAG: LamG domain-containing protein, partial [bacterium]|nr:LamG domain-containing protein [Candidatus Kapabacteria bacterium]